MCRIFGHFDAPATGHELRTVSALQRHGGPDAQHHLRGPGWALGNNRLAIMDPDGGEQPYVLHLPSGDGERAIVAVFNGEIYNHHELRAMLTARGHRFRDTCDGSILPALYVEFGAAFADHLDGMYSVALLDLRDEPALYLATDEVGMKPLYYHWHPGRRRLYFASELPALLSFREVSAASWEPGLDAYLATKTPFGEQTMFADVQVLPPASTVRVTSRAGLTFLRRGPAPGGRRDCGDLDPGAVDPGGEQEAAGALQSLLRNEVHRLTEADVPVSAITSGGLDSSLVTALAAERVRELHTFNVAYRGRWPGDERHFAREVAVRCRTRHHQVELDPAAFPELLSDVVWHLGQPNADPITLATYGLFASVRDAGYKVAVTGDAADELFGGYSRIKAAVAAPPGTDWVPAYVEALAAVPRALRDELYTDEYRRFLAAGARADDVIATTLRDATGTTLRTVTDFEIGHRLPAYHLRRVDHLSMSASVEVRLPFCQPAVVRHARSLPESWRVAGDQGKRLLHAAASGLVPESVRRRPKQPFTLPVTAMLSAGQPLLDFARDTLSSSRLRARGQLDPVRVAGLLRRQEHAPDDTAAMAIWALLVYQLWQEQFRAVAATGPVAPEVLEVAA